MKLWLAPFIAAALLVAGTAIAADAPTKAVTLTAKNGPVTFDHKAHKGETKCEKCHSDATFPQKVEPVAKDKAHGVCVECHKTEKKGPTKCNDCHKKAA
jgi:hypothetical protein